MNDRLKTSLDIEMFVYFKKNILMILIRIFPKLFRVFRVSIVNNISFLFFSLLNQNLFFSFAANSPPSMMVLTLVSSMIIAVLVVGFVVIRYIKSFRKTENFSSKDVSSYSVSRYWRRQLASNSFDQLIPSPTIKKKSKNDEGHQTIKSSFSWPEGTLVQQQQQQREKGPTNEESSSSTISSSSSLSNSSTMEQINEPSSLTFSLRWNSSTKSLWIRILNARNLRRCRSMNLLDSYVRIELISSESQGKQMSFRLHRTEERKFLLYRIICTNTNTHCQEKSSSCLR